MAQRNWIGAGGSLADPTTGNWNVAANWDGAVLPVDGDDVVFPAPGVSGAYTVTLDIASPALDSVTLIDGSLAGGTTLAIGANALNINFDVGTNNLAIGAFNGVTIAGGSITAGGVTVNGTLFGSGTVGVSSTLGTATHSINGSGAVVASGGTLNLVAQVDAGLTFTIDSGSASTLTFSGAATSNNAIVIDNVNQTLSIGGSLTINAAESITNGTILLTGGGLNVTDPAGLTVGAGATLAGFGTIVGVVGGSGVVAASGGTLTLANGLAAMLGTQFLINTDVDNSVLQLAAATPAGDGNSFTFFGAGGLTNGGELEFAQDAGDNVDMSVAGLTVGTSITIPTTFLDFQGEGLLTISSGGSGTGTTGAVTLSNGAVLNLSSISNAPATWFVNIVDNGAGGSFVFLSDTVCYCRGTLIRTEVGEIPVEDLRIGDKVVTVSGEARPIKWVGRRGYDGRFVARNRDILPVLIEAGGLGDGVPARDLMVSPEHALVIDGLFFPARMLVNGVTIRQLDAVDAIEYFHIELDTHDVIFAEAATAETFADFGGRGIFQNSEEFKALYPDAVPADWEAYARLLDAAKPRLPEIREAILARAAELGRVNRDPDLRLLIDGQTVRARVVEGGVYRFAVRAGASDLTIASRHVVPAATESDSLDPRRLGVPLQRVSVFGDGARIEMSHESPVLCDGFHADEESHRWTDGRGALPAGILRHLPGELIVEVQIGATNLHYPAERPDVENTGSEAASARRLVAAAE
jgi:hypothetical protein